VLKGFFIFTFRKTFQIWESSFDGRSRWWPSRSPGAEGCRFRRFWIGRVGSSVVDKV